MTGATTSEQTQAIKMDDLVERYIKLRDKKAEIEARHKAELRPLNDAMAQVEQFLLGQLQNLGVESVKTRYGTPYITKHTSVTTEDKTEFFGFCKDNDLWELADVRPSKTGVLGYMDEKGTLPPGLKYAEAKVLNIKRA
jgi:hypothetical protein